MSNMGETTTMYPMKPVFDADVEFKFNSSMYSMKNLLSNSDAKNKSVPQPVLSIFGEKQERILNHIKDIRKHLDTLRTMIAARSTENNVSIPKEVTVVQIPQEIVINACINYPPYSILVIPLLLKRTSIDLVQHCHSSINSLPPIAALFTKVAQKTKDSGISSLKLRLIWRKGDTKTIFGMLPMSGEVPLMRLVMHLEAGGSAESEMLLQEKLDAFSVNGLLSVVPPKSGSFLLGGSVPSALDAAVWSAVKSFPAVPKHLAPWFSAFSTLVGA